MIMVYSAKSDDSNTISQFTRMKAITVTTGGTSTPADYQVKLTITHESEMQSSFEDIRFNTLAGGYVDYWIESEDGSTATVWIELPDAITDPGSDTIWMYYGNAGLGDEGNGDDTFIQYHGAASAGFIDSLVVDYNKSIYQAKVKTTSTLHNINYGLGTNLVDEPTHGAFLKSYTYASLSDIYSIARDAGGGTIHTTQPALLNGNDYELKIVTTSTDMKHFVDDVQRGATITTNLPDSNLGLYFHIQADTATQYWSFARKYITNEPTPTYGTSQHQRRVPQFIN